MSHSKYPIHTVVYRSIAIGYWFQTLANFTVKHFDVLFKNIQRFHADNTGKLNVMLTLNINASCDTDTFCGLQERKLSTFYCPSMSCSVSCLTLCLFCLSLCLYCLSLCLFRLPCCCSVVARCPSVFVSLWVSRPSLSLDLVSRSRSASLSVSDTDCLAQSASLQL